MALIARMLSVIGGTARLKGIDRVYGRRNPTCRAAPTSGRDRSYFTPCDPSPILRDKPWAQSFIEEGYRHLQYWDLQRRQSKGMVGTNFVKGTDTLSLDLTPKIRRPPLRYSGTRNKES